MNNLSLIFIYKLLGIGKVDKLYKILNDDKDSFNGYYNSFMLIVILLSLLNLMFKTNHKFLKYTEIFSVSVFIIDYILRWIISSYDKKNGLKSYILYPLSFWAIIDLLSILPSFNIISSSFKIIRTLRVAKLLRGLRILRFFRISKELQLLFFILKKKKEALLSFAILSVGYIFITALIIFNVEGETFNTFFDAIYWATVSLTTVGYGDIYATSILGKTITMISALLGIALIAMPASIITAGLLEEVNNKNKIDNFS